MALLTIRDNNHCAIRENDGDRGIAWDGFNNLKRSHDDIDACAQVIGCAVRIGRNDWNTEYHAWGRIIWGSDLKSTRSRIRDSEIPTRRAIELRINLEVHSIGKTRVLSLIDSEGFTGLDIDPFVAWVMVSCTWNIVNIGVAQ